MYLIRIRTNKRVDDYGHENTATVGVRLKNGEFRYMRWQGFTLTIEHPVKLLVEAFTLDPFTLSQGRSQTTNENPGPVPGALPRWHRLREGEFLLGSYADGIVKARLPFTIVTETGPASASGRDAVRRGKL